MMDGDLLLIDKPKGITSFDVIRILRKKLEIHKMGHSGTLDPLATGLLIIGVGDGTKKLEALIGLAKTYEAEILLGLKTDTGDITGKTIEKKLVPVLEFNFVQKVVLEMIALHTLSVPMYSAIKKDGKPLYEYARKGEAIEPPKKEMKVVSARLMGMNGAVLKVFFEVSSGTYIRSLAELLAERLGTVGTIQNLRRLSIGQYKVENAQTIEV